MLAMKQCTTLSEDSPLALVLLQRNAPAASWHSLMQKLGSMQVRIIHADDEISCESCVLALVHDDLRQLVIRSVRNKTNCWVGAVNGATIAAHSCQVPK